MKKKQKGKRLRKSKIQDQDLEPKAIQEMKNKKEDKKDKNDNINNAENKENRIQQRRCK